MTSIYVDFFFYTENIKVKLQNGKNKRENKKKENIFLKRNSAKS